MASRKVDDFFSKLSANRVHFLHTQPLSLSDFPALSTLTIFTIFTFRCLEEGAEEFLLKPLQFSDLKKLQPYLLKSLHHYSSIDSIDNSDDNNVTVKEEVGGGENDQTNQTKSATEINHARGTVNNNIVGISRRKVQTIPERSRPTMEGLRDQGPRWRD